MKDRPELNMPPDLDVYEYPKELPPLDVERIRSSLRTRIVGSHRSVVYFDRCESTMNEALALSDTGANDGTVVVAEHQSKGRGTRNRVWVTPRRTNAILTVLLYPSFGVRYLNMASCLAVAEAVSEFTRVPATLKWPNDVLLQRRKVSGILIETKSSGSDSQARALVGIGINVLERIIRQSEVAAGVDDDALEHLVLQADGREPIIRGTTVQQQAPAPLRREDVIVSVLSRIDREYARLRDAVTGGTLVHAANDLRGRWVARLSMFGEHVTIKQQDRIVSGTAVGVTDEGWLIVELPDRRRETVGWGSIFDWED